MTSTEQNQTIWEGFSTRPKGCHRRSGTIDTVTYSLALLFYSGMRVIPVSWRVQFINKISMYLARFLQMTGVRSAQTIQENYSALFTKSDMRSIAVHQLLSLSVWNSLIFNSLSVLSWSEITNLAYIQGLTYLDDYLDKGYPVLIWSYHFGINPLIVAAILQAHGYPVHAISHVRQVPPTDAFIHRLYLSYLYRIGSRFSVIDPQEGIQLKMLDVFKNKECLYITPDYLLSEYQTQQLSVSSVASVSFLTRTVHLQTGGLRLAKRMNARVLIVFPTQIEACIRTLTLKPFELATSGFKPSDLQQDLQMCIELLEAEVLEHPYWWLDLKRRDLLKRLT
ncbi:MAG: hypothetical protein JXA33_01825 [Anaerolineae bacterium]|nr:hypothetical protein [Anaerolineae bacterium]